MCSRMFSALPVPADFAIPTCGRCGALDIDPKTATELQPLMAAAFDEELRHRGRLAVAEVCKYVSQRQLEKLIGLSQGYLSRLHARKGTPSAALVALLTLLAHEPRRRLHEIEQDWDEPYPSDRRESFHLCESCREPLPGRGA